LQRGVGWVDLTGAQTAAIETAVPPYDAVDVAMITHNHGDHYSTQSVSRHVANNPDVRIVAPPQVRANLSGIPRVESVSPPFHTKQDIVINGIEITVYHLRHFNQFGNDFSGVQNFGYLVRLGGLKLLHLGDVDYATDNLQGLGLKDENVDVVFLPTFNTLIRAANRDVILDEIDPGLVIGLHFQRNFVGGESQMVLNLYPDADVFKEPLEFRRY
jgi:L-ascorbate metabolism protein UlaG (beta-lactamase superfamily)